MYGVLHQLPHLIKSLKNRVYFRDRGSTATSYSLTPPRIEDVGLLSFARSHREDNCLRSLQLLFVNGKALHITHPREHAKNIFQRSHPAQHLELGKKIVEIERSGSQLFLESGRFFYVNRFRGALDQPDHVTHCEISSCHSLRVELLQFINLLAHSCKYDVLSPEL